MIERIGNVVRKEFLQVFRDYRMKAILFIVPVVQLVLFGYVVTTDVNNVPTAFRDLDGSYESRELARQLTASGYFTIKYRPASPEEEKALVDNGKVLCAITVDNGFARKLKGGKPHTLQAIFDGTDSNTASVAMGYFLGIVERYVRSVDSGGNYAYNDALKGAQAGVTVRMVDERSRAWFNPDLLSKNYNVPGVIAIIIMVTCLILTSMSVVREKELGTMEQLMVTPLRPVEIMAGKMLPYGIVGFADAAIATSVAVFWFNVELRGSIFLLALSTLVYLVSVLGIGLFISTMAKTQQQAMMASFLVNMPAILLSGFMFPIKNMPEPAQYVTYLNPLRYYLIIIREIFLKGNGLNVLWPELLALLAMGIAIIAVSAMMFGKRLG
ncbi:MAG: ABC transporter permease [Nitrospirae bacterium]|nr:ABC transporter permease [Nitrospirota bacterium]